MCRCLLVCVCSCVSLYRSVLSADMSLHRVYCGGLDFKTRCLLMFKKPVCNPEKNQRDRGSDRRHSLPSCLRHQLPTWLQLRGHKLDLWIMAPDAVRAGQRETVQTFPLVLSIASARLAWLIKNTEGSEGGGAGLGGGAFLRCVCARVWERTS